MRDIFDIKMSKHTDTEPVGGDDALYMNGYQNCLNDGSQKADPNDKTSDHLDEDGLRHGAVHEWMVFGSVIVVMMVILSSIHSLGTLFPYMLEEFGDSRAKTAAIQSVFFGVGLCSSLPTGMIIQHYGPKLCGVIGAILFSSGLILSSFATSTTYLLITFGIIGGLGGPPFLFLSACQASSQCFKGKTKLIALSVATSSIGVGAMAYPYLIKVTADNLGVKGTMLIIGGIATNAIPLAFLWSNPRYRRITKRIKKEENIEVNLPLLIQESHLNLNPNTSQTGTEMNECASKETHGEENFSKESSNGKLPADNKVYNTKIDDNQAGIISKGMAKPGIFTIFISTVTYKPFFLLMCSLACAIPTVNVVEILLLDVLETNGQSRDRAILLQIILNFVAIPGRMFPGLVNNIPRCNSHVALIMGTVTSGLSLILLNITHGLTGSIISCILIGMSKGILLGSMAVVPLEMLGSGKLSTAMGTIAFVNGIFTTSQGPLHGFLRDVSGSYEISLYIVTGTMCFALLFSCLSLMFESRMKRKNIQNNVKTRQLC